MIRITAKSFAGAFGRVAAVFRSKTPDERRQAVFDAAVRRVEAQAAANRRRRVAGARTDLAAIAGSDDAARLANMEQGRPEQTSPMANISRADAAQALSVDVAGTDRAKSVIAARLERIRENQAALRRELRLGEHRR
jgi:hypothetical protein